MQDCEINAIYFALSPFGADILYLVFLSVLICGEKISSGSLVSLLLQFLAF